MYTLFGFGGYCENCDESHDHPLHNIIEEYEIPDPEPTPEELAKKSAIDKLKALGLNEEEIKAILSI